ncbi:YciI family protein [Nocardioides hwasunensis]|uniref:Transcription initiation protein n=1 Tax=Nocardioides hwasunensis TaxID=397258 RepID=A0ABR8MEX6_9ACTN|nr:YciI family protein [Nocardioides hwasunensis]MBD3914652.1 transcription initiation protein [Nocardioides hwasunensis]
MTDYIVLLFGDTEAWWDSPEEGKKATYDVHGRFTAELVRRGHTIVGGAELPRASEAKSLAPHADVVTDGPWAETTEQLGGYYEVSTDDLDDLMDVCRILSDTGDAVEVRRKLTGEVAS